MSEWILPLQVQIDGELANQSSWRKRTGIDTLLKARVHLAVVREPYLSLILAGRKTIESRFSRHDRPPYGCVMRGDAILLKEPSGPIVAIAQVRQTWSFRRNGSWDEIRTRFGLAMCATDDGFWIDRADKTYATLLRLQYLLPLPKITCEKRDRRAWVIINEPHLW